MRVDTGKARTPQGAATLIHNDIHNHNLATPYPHSRPNLRRQMGKGHDSKGMGMIEQQDRRVREREEIAARVASFKATQEKFRREREEYFFTTLQSARRGEESRHPLERPPFWS
jgi:hypothetical protein